MITIDAPISFLLGAGLAVMRRDEKGERVVGRDRLLYKGLLFQCTIVSPVILFFMSRFPDWEWNYFFDARAFFFDQVSSPWGFAVLAAVVAMVNASFYVGFRVAERLLARGALQTAKRVVGGTALLILVTMAVLYDQSLHVGTFAEFSSGQASLLFTHVEFLAVLVVAGALIAAGFTWVIRSEGGAVA